MSDDTTRPDDGNATDTSPNTSQSERTGFCQDCGKPLTPATIRNVGTAVFCEPCLTARVEATSSAYTTVPPTAVPPQTTVSDEPSPALAAILGFIPGVGAMYNGQFAKGIVHLIIFAVLVSLSDNVNGIFGLFVAGWVFYMVFEAYHTAVARRDGLPLPNAFALNDIGERMGFGRPWPATSANSASTPPHTTAQTPTPPHTAAAYIPVNPVPVGTAPDWVGYVPPTTFASSAPPNPAAGYGAPCVETYTGTPLTDVPPDPAGHRFPTGALWLIGLGVLILIANLLPDWKLTERWWPPALFAGLAVWTFTRRLRSGTRKVCIVRWPVVLMVIALMLALHAAYFAVTFSLTASVLLIVFGLLLLLERTTGASPAYAPAPVASATFGSQSEETQPRTSWNAPSAAEPDPSDPKDGL